MATQEPQPGPAIHAAGVSKSFRIPKEQVHTLKERVLHPLRRSSYDEFTALRDVTFEVDRGEFFGIVGRNGSGKSTLLKCLAGILRADAGEIRVDGRVSTFIELGVGFNPDLAALDNVILNGTMLGLSRKESRRRFDSIIDFAELREFSELKLKNYSSGMLVRLAFAVMIQVDAEILLIDEVLAVGDAAFQQKCFDEFEAIRKAGRTVVLVTHDMTAVRRFCDRAMLLEHGEVVSEGDPGTTANRYLDINFSSQAREEAAAAEGSATAPQGNVFGDGRAAIEGAWFEDETGERVSTLPNGKRFTFVAEIRFHSPVEDPVFAVDIANAAGVTLFRASSEKDRSHSGRFNARDRVAWRVSFENPLGPDTYTVRPSVSLPGGASLAVHEEMLKFNVTRSASGGIVDIPFADEFERIPDLHTEDAAR